MSDKKWDRMIDIIMMVCLFIAVLGLIASIAGMWYSAVNGAR